MKLQTQSLLAGSLLLFTVHFASAGSATWNLNPPTNMWTNPANWTPATVPNGPTDVATLGPSNTAQISLAAPTSTPLTLTLDSLVFSSNSVFYTLDLSKGLSSTQLVFVGGGITNLTNLQQSINLSGGAGIVFSNAAAADVLYFTLSGSTAGDPTTSSITFQDNAVAGSLNIDVLGSASGAPGNAGADASFLDNSDAGFTAVIAYGGEVAGAAGGTVLFDGTSNLNLGATAAFGGTASGALGATVIFQGHASAGNGFVGAGEGTAGGAPGYLFFKDDSEGGTAFCFPSGGVLDISEHNPPGVTVGVFVGSGTVYLGSNNLTTGAPDVGTSGFDGTISDGGAGGGTGGSFTCGGGVVLNRASTYTGGTIVDGGGALRLAAPSGSAVGSGPVQIFNGTLSGTGSIPNTVVVGTGSGPRAWLMPEFTGRATITVRKNVHFNADATYFTLVSQKPTGASKVAARGVRIESGAMINVAMAQGSSNLRAGVVYTVLENTSAAATVGTFGNLPDGGTIVVGNRTLQSNYEGGDGNDLTLTVQ